MKLNWKAIATGSLIDQGLTLFVSILSTYLLNSWFTFIGTPLNTVSASTYSILEPLSFFYGFCFDFLGGYCAVKIAGYKYLQHSYLSSVPVTLLYLASYLNPISGGSSQMLLATLLCPLAFILGGYEAKNRSSQYPSASA
jgi:hypothetical protein